MATIVRGFVALAFAGALYGTVMALATMPPVTQLTITGWVFVGAMVFSWVCFGATVALARRTR